MNAPTHVNRDADPPLDPDDWQWVHGEDFPAQLDLELDIADVEKTPDERSIEAYDEAKKATERMD